MRILVTFAVEAEFAPWRAGREFIPQSAQGLKLWKRVMGSSEVYVILTGIGENSAITVDLMMRMAGGSRYFDFCVSSGLAGALRANYHLSDIVVAKLLRANSVHADLGQDWLETDKQLVELAVARGAKLAEAFFTAKE